MSDATPEIRMISVSSIIVLNPRARNKRIFNELVSSIAELGLKKPITVSPIDESNYNLFCGQGRLEAFAALGQTMIPAVVIEATKEDCYVMSLVENIARRHHTSIELMQEIGALKKRGYSTSEIGKKIGFSPEHVYAICYLLEHAEERLLVGIERGHLPATVAMEIARAKDGDVQRALADAYERGALPGKQIMAIRKIIDQRNAVGKTIHSVASSQRSSKRITAETLVRAYRRESQRQTLLVKKAAITQSRLLFIVTALRKLLQEGPFIALLKAEGLHTLPRPLVQRFGGSGE